MSDKEFTFTAPTGTFLVRCSTQYIEDDVHDVDRTHVHGMFMLYSVHQALGQSVTRVYGTNKEERQIMADSLHDYVGRNLPNWEREVENLRAMSALDVASLEDKRAFYCALDAVDNYRQLRFILLNWHLAF